MSVKFTTLLVLNFDEIMVFHVLKLCIFTQISYFVKPKPIDEFDNFIINTEKKIPEERKNKVNRIYEIASRVKSLHNYT